MNSPECHPDPFAEIVRRTSCDNEAIQGIGRVRAGRRGPDNPVLVIVLNRVDLGDIPVSELTTWADLTAQCGPMMQMAARGVIPKLWSDVAHVVGRWNDTIDPAASARGSFRDNPHEKALREGLLKSGLLKHSISGIEMAFRRESLGMVGRNHRYVWLAPNVTIEMARQMLP